jgi:hypothetical protein
LGLIFDCCNFIGDKITSLVYHHWNLLSTRGLVANVSNISGTSKAWTLGQTLSTNRKENGTQCRSWVRKWVMTNLGGIKVG